MKSTTSQVDALKLNFTPTINKFDKLIIIIIIFLVLSIKTTIVPAQPHQIQPESLLETSAHLAQMSKK